jgi:hypothetical protein
MRKSRYETDHARYLRKREEILEKQRIYRATYKEEIKMRRRQRAFERRMANQKPLKTQQERNRAYYLKHREEILAKQRNYDRIKREQRQRATTENAGGTETGTATTVLA